MFFKHSLITTAVLSTLAQVGTPVLAQEVPDAIVNITAAPLGRGEYMQILTPAKVLSGNDLHNKASTSLGDTLSGELGVTASGFGAGASRPIIRGLDGPRVKILQNGMEVADVSSLSNDHAVATETSTAQQIEILRGPAALLYGSGAIGGLINVVDGRIPALLPKQITGEAELRYGSVNNEKSLSFSVEGASGDIALHADGNARDTANYRIPGRANLNDTLSASGKLPSSYTRESSLALGGSYVQSWGYAGVALQTINNHYGIPTGEKSFIDLKQNRFDFDSLVKDPLAGFSEFKFKLSGTDYAHSEKAENGQAITKFINRSVNTRASLMHPSRDGWEGSWGVQTDVVRFSALSASTGKPDTVPTTKSSSLATFVVEQKTFGDVILTLGGRLEKVERTPEVSATLPTRSFSPVSASVGALWQLTPDYGLGATLSSAQRAPSTEELYSNGPHESTSTFDIGNNKLVSEHSRNLELSLQKTTGELRWKANAFLNNVSNYVYGKTNGVKVNDEGVPDPSAQFTRRYWQQAQATIRGAEAEVAYNQYGEGFSARAFADTSRGSLDNLGNLPLQTANRIGLDLGYRKNGWRNGINLIHAQQQDRLAAFETFITPSYTKLDLSVSYSQVLPMAQLTWFALVKNALNQDIRLSTSVLKETVPQPGRGLLAGVRVHF